MAKKMKKKLIQNMPSKPISCPTRSVIKQLPTSLQFDPESEIGSKIKTGCILLCCGHLTQKLYSYRGKKQSYSTICRHISMSNNAWKKILFSRDSKPLKNERFFNFFRSIGSLKERNKSFFFETEFKVSPRRFRQELPHWLQTFVKNKSQKFTFYRPYSETKISNTYIPS